MPLEFAKGNVRPSMWRTQFERCDCFEN